MFSGVVRMLNRHVWSTFERSSIATYMSVDRIGAVNEIHWCLVVPWHKPTTLRWKQIVQITISDPLNIAPPKVEERTYGKELKALPSCKIPRLSAWDNYHRAKIHISRYRGRPMLYIFGKLPSSWLSSNWHVTLRLTVFEIGLFAF